MSRTQLIPFYLAYFTIGLLAVDSVATTFLMKDRFTMLSAAELITIGIYSGLPWSLKIGIGAILQYIRRAAAHVAKSDILQPVVQLVAGLALSAVGGSMSVGILTADVLPATGAELVVPLAVSGFLISLGVVVADLNADSEVVRLASILDSGDGKVLARAQATSRLVQVVGGFIAALLSGYIATHLSTATVLTVARIFVPAMAAVVIAVSLIAGLLQVTKDVPTGTSEDDVVAKRITRDGLLGAGLILAAILFGDGNTLYIAAAQSLVLIYLFGRLPNLSLSLVATLFGLYLLRISPGVGPGMTWWITDAEHGLGFTEVQLGHMRIYSGLADLALLSLGTYMAHLPPVRILAGAILVWAGIDLLPIATYYGYVGSWAINFDSAAVSALAGLTMIPLGVLIARTVPNNGARSIYLATTATLMNAALVISDVWTTHIVEKYPVERGNYGNLGHLLVYSWVAFVLLAVVGLSLIAAAARRDARLRKQVEKESDVETLLEEVKKPEQPAE